MKRVKKQEKQQQMEMQKQQQINEGNMQSQQMAAQTAMAKIQADTQSKIQIKQAEASFSIQILEKEAEMKSHLMAEEFDYNMKLHGMEVGNLDQREQKREEAKAKRISQQNTEMSKLINQRKNNLPPVSFESNEDSMDGFDLGEFEPR
jgi:hypothetical protein